MPRRAALTLTLVATLVVGLPAVAMADEDDTITFHGGGWGHGVGMSQWGAYGMAKFDGMTADEIMRHFYTDVAPGTLGVDVIGPERLWVNILNGAVSASLTTKQITSPGAAVTYTNGSENLVVPNGDTATVTITDTTCTVSAPAGAISSTGCAIDATWDGDEDSPTSRFEIGGVTAYGSSSPVTCTNRNWHVNVPFDQPCSYSRGLMHIRLDNDTPSFHLVVEMDVDDYILGISEMPYYWGDNSAAGGTDGGGQEALEAQAIAARSYAVRRALDRDEPFERPWCWCSIYDTTVDQRYVGWGHGLRSWIDATNNTAGLVYWHPENDQGGLHRPISAFYSSSTYGATEPNEIGFGGSPVAYLRSVPDPRSLNPQNSRASWSKEMTLGAIGSALGIADITTAAITSYSPSGAASKVTFFTATGSVTKDARNLRTPLGLLSPQITGLGVPAVGGPDNVGLHDPTTGIWHLLTTTGDIVPFYYGNPADIPYAGDWNGSGTTTVGLYRQSSGFLFLRNSNTQGVADIDIYYGNPGDLPVAGDWDGDGEETVGIFRPANATVYLRNTNTQGVGDVSYMFGNSGDVPIAGDWDGDGKDSVALWRPSTNMVFFDNNLDGVADFTYLYSGAQPTDRIVAGDWNGDGVDTLGVYRTASSTFYLRDTYEQTSANIVIEMTGAEPYMSPVAGSWGF